MPSMLPFRFATECRPGHVRTARAYFLSSSQDPDNLARAEASLQELTESVDTSLDHVSPRCVTTTVIPPLQLIQTSAEYQQLLWMRVAILKRRKAAHAPLLEGKFMQLCDRIRPQSIHRIPQHSGPSSIIWNIRRITSRSACSLRLDCQFGCVDISVKLGSVLQELRTISHDQLSSAPSLSPPGHHVC